MLDSLPRPEDTTITPHWHAALRIGDIVSYRFPTAEDDGSALPKPRPCLVLEIVDIAGVRHALLAYGTTSRRRANSGYEIRLREPGAYLAAGLHEPTRFVGARRRLVALSDPAIAICRETGAPVLGRLPASLLERLHAVRARIQAESDIRADRRHQRRRRYIRPAVAGRDFLVEKRGRKQITDQPGAAR